MMSGIKALLSLIYNWTRCFVSINMYIENYLEFYILKVNCVEFAI